MAAVTARSRATPPGQELLRTVDAALQYVHAICFKTGPPERVGVELEWTLHHLDDPTRDLDPAAISAALGPHTPPTLDPDSPAQPLPHGGALTLEPGGQLEISTPPSESLTRLEQATSADLEYLRDRLAAAGLRLGEHGIDPYRRPRRLLHTPRYDAMAAAFASGGNEDHNLRGPKSAPPRHRGSEDRNVRGPHSSPRHRGTAGLTMMCATAATQVCLDAGEPEQVPLRWQAVQALGPVLLALFATARRHAGRDTGWVSARMRSWLAIDPTRTWPVPGDHDPATAWAQYALAAPLLCLRRPGGSWHAPPGVTFADWIAGAISPAPTVADLDYHLGTLFPPVRPRGYLEVRYLDAQPPQEWFVPVAVLAALLADPATVTRAYTLAAPVANEWTTAARHGLADPAIRKVATEVAELAGTALDQTDLAPTERETVVRAVSRRLAAGEEG